MVYQTIRLCAYKLKSNIPAKKYYAMNFPDEAKQFIRMLASKRDRTPIDRTNIPINSLNKGLRTAPGLIHMGKVSPKEGEFWLYSPHQLSERALSAILDYWIETEFPDEPSKRKKVGISYDERQLAMSYLSPDNLVWEEKEISYTSNFATHPNGTAMLSGNDFILLPHILAEKLSKPELKFDLDGRKLQFYRTISSNGKRAELISLQPLPYRKDGQTYYYSIVLTLSVVTIPGQPYPQIHITPSIRRWLSINDSQLSNNHASNAYIRAKLNWGKALNPKNSTEYFVNCPMVSNNGVADWDENLAKLLEELDILSISPQQILAEPSAALRGNPNIGITYKDGMEPAHLVAKGFPTANLYQLMTQIDKVFEEDLEPIYCQRQDYHKSKQFQFFDLKRPKKSFAEPLVKNKAETEKQFELRRKSLEQTQATELTKCLKKKTESKSDYQIRRKELEKKQEQELIECKPKLEETEEAFQERRQQFYQELSRKQAELRQAIRSSIGEHLTIWIWYIKDYNLVERLKAIQYCLGLPKAEPGIYPFPEGLTVNIRIQEAGIIAERLNLPTKHKPRRTQLEEAVNNRITEIAKNVQPVKSELPGKIGVWFELYGKECYNKYPRCDPKNAIRLGFAGIGIGSQFITPERKSYHQKAISSFIDLLRFLGVRLAPSHITLPNVDKDTPINVVAVYLVNRTSQTSAHGRAQLIPVMVKMSSLTAEISAIYPGLAWIPYDEAATRINKEGRNFTNDVQGKAAIRNWIEQILAKKELRDKPTILYCDVVNIRQVWTWLQDTQISTQGLSFAERDNPVFISMPGLRVIRIRTGNETAEYYGIDEERRSGFVTGIFKNPDNDRVVLSLGDKPATMKGLNTDSKIKKPEKVWSHPSIVEITIGYCQEGDRFLDLAAIAHQSRQGVLQYQGFLEKPRVLHDAEQIIDYALMLEDEDESE
jgi:Skp family chaperone for outer membrane proteins